MKRIAIYGLALGLLIGYTSCSNIKKMNTRRDGDDVYYSLKDAKKDRAAAKKRADAEQKQKEAEDQQKQLDQQTSDARSKPGSDYYDKNFNYDDYYDYEYAARLRRFDHPVNNAGYYDNYYTNSYFYNQNPYYYGTSVYNGYNFWGPSYYAYNYNPSSYWMYNNGWGWGVGYNNGWGNQWGNYYDPWNPWGYSPYGCGMGYGFGYNPYGYGGYGMGYGNGFGNGYGSGYNNYYYNSFDSNSNYYGPRNSPSSSDGRVVGSGGPTFGERFEQTIASENHLSNPTREQVNHIVGVPAPETQSTSVRNNNANNPTSSSGVMSTRDNSGGTYSTTGRDGGSTSSVPANPNYSHPANTTYDHPSTTYSHPAGNSPSSGNSNNTYSRPERTAPSYSAPSGNNSGRTMGGGGGSSSGSGNSAPRSSSGTGSRPR